MVSRPEYGSTGWDESMRRAKPYEIPNIFIGRIMGAVCAERSMYGSERNWR